MWKEFLRKVYGNDIGYAFIGYKREDKWRDKPFTYPDNLDGLVEFVEEANNWADVYFCAHLTSMKRRQKDTAKDIKALWIDKDKGGYKNLSPKPTVCWKTSEGKYQALWVLKEHISPNRAEKINRYLTYKNKGDRGGWHLTKYLRFPGSINHKYDTPQEGEVLWIDGPEYLPEDLEPTEEDFREVYEEELNKNIKEIPDETKLPTLQEVFIKYGKDIPPVAYNLMNETPTDEDDWSANLWRLERLLKEAKLPLEAVFVLVRESPWNKYRRDNRSDAELWEDVAKAFKEDPQEIKEEKELPWEGLNSLLVYHERPEWLVEDMWMDKNVGWIAGVGKSYKTVISLDLALSISSGKPFLDKFEVKKPGPVLLLQEEDPKWRLAHRLKVMAEHKGITPVKGELTEEGLLLKYAPLDIPLYASVGGAFEFGNEDKVEAMEQAIKEYKPRMVILDPFFMLTSGFDEYKTGEMTGILNRMKYWRNEYGCSIAVVHHYKKGDGEGHDRLYGSMALYAWSENSLFVTKPRDSNISTITRDIKDAVNDYPISVQVNDIEDKYDIEVVEGHFTSSGGKVSKKAVICNFLAKQMRPVTKKELMGGTHIAQRTIESITPKLEEEGYLEEIRQGRGGTKLFKPTEKLKKEFLGEGFDMS